MLLNYLCIFLWRPSSSAGRADHAVLFCSMFPLIFFWCAQNRTVSEQPILKREHFQVSRFRKRQLKGERCKLPRRGPAANAFACILGWEIAASSDEFPSWSSWLDFYMGVSNTFPKVVLRRIRNCCTALSYALRGRAAAQLRGNVGSAAVVLIFLSVFFSVFAAKSSRSFSESALNFSTSSMMT